MLGWITEDPSRGQGGHILYSRGPPGYYMEGLQLIAPFLSWDNAIMVSSCTILIKWCHNGVILHHHSSFECFNSLYVPMTSFCIVITNCIMCQLLNRMNWNEFSQTVHVELSYFSLTSIVLKSSRNLLSHYKIWIMSKSFFWKYFQYSYVLVLVHMLCTYLLQIPQQ